MKKRRKLRVIFTADNTLGAYNKHYKWINKCNPDKLKNTGKQGQEKKTEYPQFSTFSEIVDKSAEIFNKHKITLTRKTNSKKNIKENTKKLKLVYNTSR